MPVLKQLEQHTSNKNGAERDVLHARTHTHAHTHVRTRTHARTHIHTHAHTHTHTPNTHTHTHTHTHTPQSVRGRVCQTEVLLTFHSCSVSTIYNSPANRAYGPDTEGLKACKTCSPAKTRPNLGAKLRPRLCTLCQNASFLMPREKL